MRESEPAADPGPEMVTLTVYYVDGSRQSFERKRQEHIGVVGEVHRTLSGAQLLLDLPDKTVVIPYTSVLRLEVSPRPYELPEYAVSGFREVS